MHRLLNPLVVGGLSIWIFGLFAAIFLHSPYWYSMYTVGGFLLFEGFNAPYGFSFLKYPLRFFFTWLILNILGIFVEILGIRILHLWYYPSYDLFNYVLHVALIGYAFTGFFGLGFLVWLQRVVKPGTKQIFVLLIAAWLFGYAVELPNLFAYEWKYTNWPIGDFLGIPIFISVLWLLILGTLLFKPFFQFIYKK